nr:hypothetical protein Clen_415 [Cedratvirus lena]WIL04583.1 hypothetical protein Cduv_103 [Cedratvirus duvanny]
MEIELLPLPQPLPSSVENLNLNLSLTEINAICLQDKSKLEIFNQPEFWRDYFAKHKLCILEQGSSPASWSTIFRKTRESCLVVNFLFAKVFPDTIILNYQMQGEENPKHFVPLDADLLKKVFLRLHLSQREKKPFSFTSLGLFNMCRDESKIIFTLSFTKKGNYLASFHEHVNQDAKNKIVEQELSAVEAKQLALSVFYFYLNPR